MTIGTISDKLSQSSANRFDALKNTLRQGLPGTITIDPRIDYEDPQSEQEWTISGLVDDAEYECIFVCTPGEDTLTVNSIKVDDRLGGQGIGKNIIQNLINFSTEFDPATQYIGTEAGEDYGGIAWASWGFIHDTASGVRETVMERLEKISYMVPEQLFKDIKESLTDPQDELALCKIAKSKTDIGGHPINILLLGETNGYAELDIQSEKQRKFFEHPENFGDNTNANRAPPEDERPNPYEALLMHGLV